MKGFNMLGFIASSNGEYERAIEYTKEALQVAKLLNEHGRIHTYQMNIANYLHSAGFYEDAIGYYKELLELDEAEGYELGMIKNLINLGSVTDM